MYRIHFILFIIFILEQRNEFHHTQYRVCDQKSDLL